MHIQGSPVENQTPKLRNPIYRSKTAQLPVIAQIRLVALPFPRGKTRRAFQKHFIFSLFKKLRKYETM